MKIIFLDIDGVLNSEDWYERRSKEYSNIEISEKYPKYEFDPLSVVSLNMITNETNASIVISSSWRHGKTLDQLTELFTSVGITGDVVGFTDDFTYNELSNGKEIINYRIPRGCEIDYWIKNNKIENYLILDDDIDMLYSQKDNFIPINAWHGLTKDNALESIKILNR